MTLVVVWILFYVFSLCSRDYCMCLDLYSHERYTGVVQAPIICSLCILSVFIQSVVRNLSQGAVIQLELLIIIGRPRPLVGVPEPE